MISVISAVNRFRFLTSVVNSRPWSFHLELKSLLLDLELGH